MPKVYLLLLKTAFLLCFCLSATSLLTAQGLTIERELIGAVVAHSTSNSSGDQELQIDASFGETCIGYEAGDITVTVGFHQPTTRRVGRSEGTLPQGEVVEAAPEVNVNTFPNPTVERITVDLGKHADQFSEVHLVDASGRPLKRQQVNGRSTIIIDRLAELPNANYYLVARDKQGKIHQLSTVMIITY